MATSFKIELQQLVNKQTSPPKWLKIKTRHIMIGKKIEVNALERLFLRRGCNPDCLFLTARIDYTADFKNTSILLIQLQDSLMIICLSNFI